MSYQNGANRGSGYQPIESSTSDVGECAIRRRPDRGSKKMRISLSGVQTPPIRMNNWWMDIESPNVWSN